jgi:hypothetical protein
MRKMVAQVGYDAIVIEQRVVHIKQEYHLARYCHFAAFTGIGLCQFPSGAMSASACFGPQLPGL